MNKVSINLPDDWQYKTINSIGEVITGSTPRTNNPNFWEGEFMFYTPSDIDNSIFTSATKRKVSELGLQNNRPIPSGTVLVTCIGSIGKIAISTAEIAITNQQINSIICNNQVNNYFVYFLMIANEKTLKEKASKTTLPIINKTNFLSIELPMPRLPEQKKIAVVLFKIQQAIEAQEKILTNLQELKKSTMEYLFTHGTKGEKTKQTKIGAIPENWEIKKINKVTLKTEQINPKSLSEKTFLYIDVSSISRKSLSVENPTLTPTDNAPGRARKLVKAGDVIMATVRPTLKRIAFITNRYDNQICSTAFCVLRSDDKIINNKFLYYVIQRPYVFSELESQQRGASYPAVTDKNIKSLYIPVPSLSEQRSVVFTLDAIENKLLITNNKLDMLHKLFNSMLNKLMAGKIRVKDLDIDVSAVE